MITNFIEGHYYKFNKPEILDRSCWNRDGRMDFILDGKPHKCTFTLPMSIDYCPAELEGSQKMWNWAKYMEFFVDRGTSPNINWRKRLQR